MECLGRYREALGLVEKAHAIASEHGLIALANKIEPILNDLRQSGY